MTDMTSFLEGMAVGLLIAVFVVWWVLPHD